MSFSWYHKNVDLLTGHLSSQFMTVAMIFAENVGWVIHTEKLLHNHVLGSGGIVSEVFYRSNTEQTDQRRFIIFPRKETPMFGDFWVQNYIEW